MTKKISFDVENVEMIDENRDSNFAVISLDFFASGDNLHDMYVSEKTLFQTAHTIKNCPLVWKYDETLDDVYTHDKDEVPCGFVPETSTIISKRMQDGRTMLSVVAYVWKRYTGELLSFFKRDGGKKPVSVEMSVYNLRELPNNKLELLDFKYEGITILGSFVTPAIPLAQATVLSFTNEYMKDLQSEFPTKYVDMSTSKIVTLSSEELSEGSEKMDKETIKENLGLTEPEKEEKSMEKDKVIESDTNVEEVEMTEDAKVEDTKVEEVEMTEDAKEEDTKVEEVEMAEDTKVEDTKVEEEKKFGFPKSITLEDMQSLFAKDEDDDDKIKYAREEIQKGESADPEILMSGMFAKIQKMYGVIERMAEESKVYMAENEELKKFKTGVEESQKTFAVEQTMRELEEKKVVPEEAKAEMLAEAENYSFADIEAWKTLCKAKSFDFATKEKEDSSNSIKRAGLPFGEESAKSKSDLWQ